MRFLLLLLVLLPVPSYALGDQEILYVRPAGACTFSGNGLAYGCAASTNALGAEVGIGNVLFSATDGTAGSLDPNDILYICGTHLVTSPSDRFLFKQSGNATDGYLTFSGACPGDPGTIDGGGIQSRLVWISARHHVIIEDLTITQACCNDYVIEAHNSGIVDDDRFAIIRRNRFIETGATTAVVWMWGAHFTVTDNYVNGARNDVFYLKGGRDSEVSRNTCLNFSQGVATGDCVQFDSSVIPLTGTIKVNGNYCVKEVDLKYCILSNDHTGYAEFIGNTLVCPVASSNPSGCSPLAIGGKAANQTHEIIATRNTIRNGWRGFTCFTGNNPTTPSQFIGNDVSGAGTIGAWFNNGCDNWLVANNTFTSNGLLDMGSGGEHALYLGMFVNPTGSANITITNNIFANNHSGIFYIGSIDQPRTTNDYFGQVAINIERSGVGSQALEGTALTVDPLFLVPGGADYRLSASSPMRAAGTALASCVDILGQPCAATPDLGAYQFHAEGMGRGGKGGRMRMR